MSAWPFLERTPQQVVDFVWWVLEQAPGLPIDDPKTTAEDLDNWTNAIIGIVIAVTPGNYNREADK